MLEIMVHIHNTQVSVSLTKTSWVVYGDKIRPGDHLLVFKFDKDRWKDRILCFMGGYVSNAGHNWCLNCFHFPHWMSTGPEIACMAFPEHSPRRLYTEAHSPHTHQLGRIPSSRHSTRQSHKGLWRLGTRWPLVWAGAETTCATRISKMWNASISQAI